MRLVCKTHNVVLILEGNNRVFNANFSVSSSCYLFRAKEPSPGVHPMAPNAHPSAPKCEVVEE